MSFTTKIKEEIVSKDLSETEKYSILAGFVRNNATWYEDKLQLINENGDIDAVYISSRFGNTCPLQYFSSKISFNSVKSCVFFISLNTSCHSTGPPLLV